MVGDRPRLGPTVFSDCQGRVPRRVTDTDPHLTQGQEWVTVLVEPPQVAQIQLVIPAQIGLDRVALLLVAEKSEEA